MRRIGRQSGRRAVVVALPLPLALVALCAAAVIARPQAPALAGSWEGSYSGQQLALVLKADGTGALNGQPFNYSVRGRNLVA